MSNDGLDKAADAVKRAVDNVKDNVHETHHRASADAEKTKRDVAGNNMTAGEKIGSIANEAKHRTQAEIDAAKRELRNKT